MSATLDLARALIARRSVTPDDAGCQQLLSERLAALGFAIESMPFGAVSNLWARRGNQSPLFCFAGHTDVVPAGPLERWISDPFVPDIRDGRLYGRGAADMKGSLAAMLVATETFLAEHPEPRGSIGFLITSDEEGAAVDGTARVIDRLRERGERIDYCLVGEPSSRARVGDEIKNGRRGSLNGRLRVLGRQGHIAYPQLANNPVHAFAPTLACLCAEVWDRGNAYFPPTSFQVSNLHAGVGAENVIPGQLDMQFNLRFSTELTADRIKERMTALLDTGGFDYQVDWRLSGQPFLTPDGTLVAATKAAVRAITGHEPALSTAGGTSDGRFIAPTGAEVVELGPCNATIHQIDECVDIAELEQLSRIHTELLHRLLVRGTPAGSRATRITGAPRFRAE